MKIRAPGAAVIASGLVAFLSAGPLPASALGPVSVGAGVYGVHGIPLLQQDAAPGPLYGLKARANVLGPVGAEIYYTTFQEGDRSFVVPLGTQVIKGGTDEVMGGDLILASSTGPGVSFYVAGGAGSYTLTREPRTRIRTIGYNGGPGLELRSTAGISIDLSGRVHVVPLQSGGSRKFASLQAGINYYFLE